MSDWHGWDMPDAEGVLHVGHLPGRKRVCLYLVQGSVMYTLAYFRDETEADRLLTYLDSHFHLTQEKLPDG